MSINSGLMPVSQHKVFLHAYVCIYVCVVGVPQARAGWPSTPMLYVTGQHCARVSPGQALGSSLCRQLSRTLQPTLSSLRAFKKQPHDSALVAVPWTRGDKVDGERVNVPPL